MNLTFAELLFLRAALDHSLSCRPMPKFLRDRPDDWQFGVELDNKLAQLARAIDQIHSTGT